MEGYMAEEEKSVIRNYQRFIELEFPNANKFDVKKLTLFLHILDQGLNTHFVFEGAITLNSKLIRSYGFDSKRYTKWLETKAKKYFDPGYFGDQFRSPIQVGKEVILEDLRTRAEDDKFQHVDGSYSRPFYVSEEARRLQQKAHKFFNQYMYEQFEAGYDAYTGVLNTKSTFQPHEDYKIHYARAIRVSDHIKQQLINLRDSMIDQPKKKSKNSRRSDNQAISKIDTILGSLNDNNEFYSLYRKGTTGRLVENPGMIQGARSDIRDTVFDGYYDYDITSAHYNLLVNLIDAYEDQIMTIQGSSYNGDFELIRACANDAKVVRWELAKYVGCTYEQSKRVLISVLYGAKVDLSDDQIESFNNQGTHMVLEDLGPTKFKVLRDSPFIKQLMDELKHIYKWISVPNFLIDSTGRPRLKLIKKLITFEWRYETDPEFFSRLRCEWIDQYKQGYHKEPTKFEIDQFMDKVIKIGTKDQEGRTLKKKVYLDSFKIKNEHYRKLNQVVDPKKKLSHFLQLLESLVLDVIIDRFDPSAVLYDGFIVRDDLSCSMLKKVIKDELELDLSWKRKRLEAKKIC